MSTIQQRKAEILAKRAKLAELKRQRELRQQEFNQNRASGGDTSEVYSFDASWSSLYFEFHSHVSEYRRQLLFPAARIAEQSSMT